MIYDFKVLSQSMADGIKFYRESQCAGLNGSEETEEFTRLFNNCFDALNRKFPKEGVRKNSNDLKVNYLYVFYYCNSIKYFRNLSFNCINGFNFRFYRIQLILLMLGNKMSKMV